MPPVGAAIDGGACVLAWMAGTRLPAGRLRVPRPQSSRRCAAGLVGADFSPSRFSRLASLLAWPNGEIANCKQKSRKPLRKSLVRRARL